MRNAKVFITPLAANGAHRSGQYFNSILSSDNRSALKPEQFYGWIGALYESDFRPFYCLPCSIRRNVHNFQQYLTAPYAHHVQNAD